MNKIITKYGLKVGVLFGLINIILVLLSNNIDTQVFASILAVIFSPIYALLTFLFSYFSARELNKDFLESIKIGTMNGGLIGLISASAEFLSNSIIKILISLMNNYQDVIFSFIIKGIFIFFWNLLLAIILGLSGGILFGILKTVSKK